MENELKSSGVAPRNAENAEGFGHVMNKILKIVRDGNAADDRSQIDNSKIDQLIALLEEVNLKHRTLAEQRYHSVDETCQDSSLLTPDQKVASQKTERQAVDTDFHMSSGSSISIHSGKQGSEYSELNSSSSSSSSNSDAESYYTTLNKGSTPNSVDIPKGKYLDMETGITRVELANGFPSSGDNESYDLMGVRIAKYEEGLRDSKDELLSSKQEVMRLQSELKSALVAVDDLEAKLEIAKSEEKLRERVLALAKNNVSKLQVQVTTLQGEVLDSGNKIRELAQEKQAATAKLESSEEKISELEHKIAERDDEIKKLNVALQYALRESESEKAEFQSELSLVEAKLATTEEHTRSLENEVKKCETSKIEMKNSYEAREIRWLGEIKGLNMQLNEKNELVESLNRTQDGLKLKYDMLASEKDGLNAKVQTLGAELCASESNMQQLEIQLHQLQTQKAELIARSETAMRLRDELGLKVEKLEKEAERQAALIEDRAEEKREAIRQLCLSLEHYRSGYKELREAWIGQMRHTVMAS